MTTFVVSFDHDGVWKTKTKIFEYEYPNPIGPLVGELVFFNLQHRIMCIVRFGKNEELILPISLADIGVFLGGLPLSQIFFDATEVEPKFSFIQECLLAVEDMDFDVHSRKMENYLQEAKRLTDYLRLAVLELFELPDVVSVCMI